MWNNELSKFEIISSDPILLYTWKIQDFFYAFTNSNSIASPEFDSPSEPIKRKISIFKIPNKACNIGNSSFQFNVHAKNTSSENPLISKFRIVVLNKGGFSRHESEWCTVHHKPAPEDKWTYNFVPFLSVDVDAHDKMKTTELALIDSATNYEQAIIGHGSLIIQLEVLLDCVIRQKHPKEEFESVNTSLMKMYRKKIFADLEFVTKSGRNIFAHKAVLAARSPVFEAMFNSDMLEANNSKIEIIDFDEETVQEMIQYLYTGEISEIENCVVELLMISDKYALQELKLKCETWLSNNLSTNIKCLPLIFELLSNYNVSILKDHVKKFIQENETKLKKEKSYQEAVRKYPLLHFELYF